MTKGINLNISGRKYFAGAELLKTGGVSFRLWAPKRKRVSVVIEIDCKAEDIIPLENEGSGFFSGIIKGAKAGTLYRFKLDNNTHFHPDPFSRFQPEGPHRSSEVINIHKFKWTDKNWKGVSPKGQVAYEVHIGTFTKEGTWKSAAEELQELKELGITVIEIMPVGEFPGDFGWGYDGVNLFAPYHVYGRPDDFRSFVNEAHNLGIGVILDVVYNHLGPDGNYTREFTDDFFSKKEATEWGEGINYDGINSWYPREFVKTNAAYWIEEFHLDGLRLDATQDIKDASGTHIISEIETVVRKCAKGRSTFIVGENEPQECKLIKPKKEGGYNIDALWNDDFHHTATVALMGRDEAYYTDYTGTPQEFISAIKYGYLYQGQHYKWQKKRRGSASLGINPASFVLFIQNHDQIANSARGLRIHKHSSPGAYRAITALMILAPGTPMLFQGQEFATSTPFYYFADHNKELAKLVSKGRIEFLKQFASMSSLGVEACVPDPAQRETFESCILNFEERNRYGGAYKLHKDLISLKRNDPVFSIQEYGIVDGAVLGNNAFLLRWIMDDCNDRLLLINIGVSLHLSPAPEPLLAPPENTLWKVIWTSEKPEYGGSGTPPVEDKGIWNIPGFAAVVLAPVKRTKTEEDFII